MCKQEFTTSTSYPFESNETATMIVDRLKVQYKNAPVCPRELIELARRLEIVCADSRVQVTVPPINPITEVQSAETN